MASGQLKREILDDKCVIKITKWSSESWDQNPEGAKCRKGNCEDENRDRIMVLSLECVALRDD